jgi:branched-chain amino acid transport system substrate-binding protein
MPRWSQAADELVIGIVAGLTGSTATWGSTVVNMTQLISKEIDAAGGFKVKGKKVKVVFKYYDSESNPQVGSSVTERAISDGARVIMAGPQSSVDFASSEICERAGVVYINCYNTSDKLTERGFKYYFRLNASSKMTVQDSIAYLLYQEKKTGHKMKNVAIFSQDDVTGRSKGAQYAEFIPRMAPHWKIVGTVFFPPKTNNFTPWMKDFKEKKVEVLLGDQLPTNAILVTRQCREIDYNPVAIHGAQGGWYDPEYGKNLQWQAIGTTDTAYFSPFTKIPGVKKLNDKYKKLHGVDIPQNSANVATGISVIKEAVERAGSINADAIRDALRQANITRKEYKEGDWWYIKSDDVKFDQTGQNVKAASITNVWTTPTRFEPVFPPEYATTTAPWPRLTWTELKKKYGGKFPLGN